ncbi:MAG TPA: glycosyltransferase family 39 protein [Gaiellales bacterium]|nr:glycosyltransferase family 39 protein [Gaiellales bacterium]
MLFDRWPPLVALAATGAYAVSILGFGLDFRPLHNDEGVTLQVASQPSLADVLRVAVDVRHGPPLHYLLVHLSLAWRTDMLGLRLPSALLGIAAVALSYGCGRELLGRSGGAIVSVVVAASPVVVHLGQFARGYTSMVAFSFLSLWMLMVLVRTRRVRWVAPYAVAALLLVSSHPFGLFALASELVLLALLAGWELRGTLRRDRPAQVALASAAVLALVALVVLRHVYAPLQTKYAVGSGGPVVHLGSAGFWNDLGGNAAGTSSPLMLAVLAATVIGGVASLALRRQRAGLVAGVWLALPLTLLAVLTAASSDFAPERHLSFLAPGFALAVAGAVLELARHGRYAPAVAAIAFAGLMVPAVLADQSNLSSFNSDLRTASVALGYEFGSHDVLLTSAGLATSAEDPRLYGAYAVLVARSGSPLSRWRQVGNATGCRLARLLDQGGQPSAFFMLLRPQNPPRTATALRRQGAAAQVFGGYVVVRYQPRFAGVGPTLWRGQQLWRTVAESSTGVHQFVYLQSAYRQAFVRVATHACAGLTLAS